MPVPKWLWPRYDESTKAEHSVMTASGSAWLFAIIGVVVALYDFSNSKVMQGAGQLVAAGFWTVAGWRIRKFSTAWAGAALVAYALSTVIVIVQSRLGILTIVFLFAFINGSRATRAHHLLKAEDEIGPGPQA